LAWVLNLSQGAPDPALDGIYKLSDVGGRGRHIPKMKLSEETMKATLPGKNWSWRIYENGTILKDMIALEDEAIDNAYGFT
jgi:nicotinate phosphoribosyltransferase